VSGADLIGPVPPHWSVKPLRLIGRFLKGSGGSKEDAVEEGVPCVRYGELYTTHRNFIERAQTCITQERASDYTPIEYGDVLFAASGETIEEIGKSAVNLLHGARCGGDVVILRPTEGFVPRFLGYATDAAPVAAQKSLAGRGSTVKHIYPDELREVVIAIPPVDEQLAIAEFLDRETARIDALIGAKQRLLDLLAEKRKAIIATAVTRGLDPKVKLRDSGVPWLGGIPVHWDIRRVRTLSEFITSGPRGWSERVSGEGSLFIQSGDLNDVLQVEFATAKRVRVDDDAEAARTRLQDGDIVVCITGAKTGNVAVCASVPEPAYVNQHLCLVRPNRAVLTVFLGAALKSTVGQAQLALFQYGLKQGLNLENVREVLIALPALDEQRAIVEHIARETAKLDAVRAATERTIALLKERRSALIAAAVTGQLDLTTGEGAAA